MRFFGIFGYLFVFVLIFLAIKRVFSNDGVATNRGDQVRRFFQFGLLFALVVISATGVSGIISRIIGFSNEIVSSQSALARDTSFSLVGIPLLILVARWVRKSVAEDKLEIKTFGWNIYFVAISIVSLIVTMIAANAVLTWLVAGENFNSGSVARFIVWMPVWFLHYRLHAHLIFGPGLTNTLIIGSVIGLVTVVTGAIETLQNLINLIFGSEKTLLLFESSHPLMEGFITFLIGATVWYLYWLRITIKSERNTLWYAYVLLAGTGGGIVMMIVSASFTLYQSLIWFIGDTKNESASSFFNDLPGTVAAFAVGLTLWWYHKEVLESKKSGESDEVRRIYQYLMAGISLIAAAAGISMILISVLEKFSAKSVIYGAGSINTLIGALTLIIVGAPIWWIYWNKIERQLAAHPSDEYASPTRRFYLFLLFGVSGVVAVVMLLIGVAIFFEAVFQSNLGSETIRKSRTAVSLLITTAGISWYHWLIYRDEKKYSVAKMTPVASHHYPAIDCEKPIELAQFYAALTGYSAQLLKDVRPEVEWVDLFHNGKRMMGFQKIDNYRRPTWPTGAVPQQMHLDFEVPDLDEGEKRVIALGATKAEYQPGESFRVYLDPEGHPFCLVMSS